MSALGFKSEPRHVRVTIEAEAVPYAGTSFLRINVGPSTAVIDPDASNVTVEDITPPREWRDGDVILDTDGDAWQRRNGRWYCSDHGYVSAWSDDAATVEAEHEGSAVLRYQAGEDQ